MGEEGVCGRMGHSKGHSGRSQGDQGEGVGDSGIYSRGQHRGPGSRDRRRTDHGSCLVVVALTCEACKYRGI